MACSFFVGSNYGFALSCGHFSNLSARVENFYRTNERVTMLASRATHAKKSGYYGKLTILVDLFCGIKENIYLCDGYTLFFIN